eukprot:4881692-Pyramimonas_sp.AAC.1
MELAPGEISAQDMADILALQSNPEFIASRWDFICDQLGIPAVLEDGSLLTSATADPPSPALSKHSSGIPLHM